MRSAAIHNSQFMIQHCPTYYPSLFAAACQETRVRFGPAREARAPTPGVIRAEDCGSGRLCEITRRA